MGRPLASLVGVAMRHGAYDIAIATTAAEARAAIASGPRLAFVDLDYREDLLDAFTKGRPKDGTLLVGLTRHRSITVKLAAFDRGVDDVVEVPFTLDEILGRAYALVRRATGSAPRVVPKIKLDRLEVDLVAQRVTAGKRSFALSALQQTLLCLLAANQGEILSREEILDTIWGASSEIESNVVDRHVRDLRSRLGDDWRSPTYIETVPGKGYRYVHRDNDDDPS